MCWCHGPVAQSGEHNLPESPAVQLLMAVTPQRTNDIVNILNVLDQQHPDSGTKQAEGWSMRCCGQTSYKVPIFTDGFFCNIAA